MIFGITEAGDASIDYTWVHKMNQVDGAILITKNITNKFIEEILKVKDKVILHCSCTGYGGSILEPNLPVYQRQLNQLQTLLSLGFPSEKVVIRIDPIIPTKKGIQLVEKVITYAKETLQLPVHRFRVSVIDMYPHVQKRFKDAKLPIPFEGNFQASKEEFELLDKSLNELSKKYKIQFESCAEKYLYSVKATGCVSHFDMNLLHLEMEDDNIDLKHQRPLCLCCADKTELLEHKQCNHYGCSYQCLYCYWR